MPTDGESINAKNKTGIKRKVNAYQVFALTRI
jgi:hypothetical protein